MKIIFLGVGEAFDEKLPNNSHLILSDTILLLDCGYSVPKQLWQYNPNQSFIDAIYISHAHADHYFGIPALLVRMWEEGRTKPLTIICQKGLREIIHDVIELAYRTIFDRLKNILNFIVVEKGQRIKFNEFYLEFAPTIHSISNLAIKITKEENSLCYSGDGMFNEDCEKLYRDTELVIHEAYFYDQRLEGHANIVDLLKMASRNNVKCLALTHLQRDLRKNEIKTVKDKISKEQSKVIIPEPMEKYYFK